MGYGFGARSIYISGGPL